MLNRFLSSLFRRARTSFRRGALSASRVDDANITRGTDWNAVYRDRYNYQRETVLAEALQAWRTNPLARRLVTLTRQYVVDGIEFECAHEGTARFLAAFWDHPLNRIGQHLAEWCDELSLTGNLFPLLTTDSAGMSYVRIFPTDRVQSIESAANDVQQETAYLPKATVDQPDPKPIPSYWTHRGRRPRTVMLHYAVNRLAGMQWGEPDLGPVLQWLGRYAGWIEDRVRLNRFRQAFLFIVKGRFQNEAERDARQRQLLANPPPPGSILVTDDTEDWDVINPRLDSFEANTDGLALKKFIAGGQGVPLHWLAEPESATRTTAEAAGTPTFKTLEERQRLFLAIVQDVLRVAVARRAARGDASVDPEAEIIVRAADISERDNAALALASSQIVSSFGQLAAQGFISADEYLRIVYRFAGEVLPARRPDNPASRPAQPRGASGGRGIHIDAESGEVSTDA